MTHLPRPRGTTIADYIEWALDTANIVVADYLRRSERPEAKKRSADDILAIISENHFRCHNCHIAVYVLEEQDDYKSDTLFLGLVKRVDGGAPEIFLNPFQDEFGMRLGLVQEGYQALLDEVALRSPELDKAIQNYIDFREERDFNKAKGPTFGEIIAEIAAMHTLFSYPQRLEWKAKCGGNPSDSDYSAIANEYGIPAKWVKFYLQDEIMQQLAQFEPTPESSTHT